MLIRDQLDELFAHQAVSYTHLDVYKRQPLDYFATIDGTPYWVDIEKETEALNLWTKVSDSKTKV